MSDRSRSDLATADGHDRYVPSKVKDVVAAGHEGVYEWVAQRLVSEGTRFLDLGCGTGYGAAIVAAAGATFDGTDVSPAAIDYARAAYERPGTRFFVADLMGTMPPQLEPRSYDVVFSSEVLEHVVDPFALVRLMAHYVKDDGVCFVGTPNRLWTKANMPGGAPMSSSHVMEFTPAGLLSLLEGYFGEVSMMLRMFPEDAVHSTVVPSEHPRLLRAALAFTRELAPAGLNRCRDVLQSRKGSREWSASDIEWVPDGDPKVEASRCVGLVAICRSPKR